MRGYSNYRKDFLSSDRATGGVSLLIANDIPQNPIPLNTNLQDVAVQVNFQQLITVCSIYFPPNDALRQHNLNSLKMQLPSLFYYLETL